MTWIGYGKHGGASQEGENKLCFSHYHKHYPRQERRTSAQGREDKALTPSIVTSTENAGGMCGSGWAGLTGGASVLYIKRS